MTAFVVEKFRIWPDMYIDLIEFYVLGKRDKHACSLGGGTQWRKRCDILGEGIVENTKCPRKI